MALQPAQIIRDAAGKFEDIEEVTLGQSLADYLDSTTLPDQIDRVPTQKRVVMAEIAMAFVAGYEHATGNTPRELHRAIRSAGLSI